jgi:putative acetyltransferase
LRDVFFNSFSEEEAPETFKLISEIICNESEPPSLCLGYKVKGKIVGAIALSPVYFGESANLTAYILAPLAVHKAFQNNGIASELIEEAKSILKKKSIDALLVYGDPNFYQRYDFKVGVGASFVPPYPLEYEFGWQALMLSSKELGTEKHHFKCVEALSDASFW